MLNKTPCDGLHFPLRQLLLKQWCSHASHDRNNGYNRHHL
jgi:hypothetical protein